MTQPSSYAQILKPSSLMGGVAVVELLLGMVRIKFAAVLIGATGTGLAVNVGAIQGFIGTLAGMGIQSVAVREVASAYAKGDQQEVGRTILTLRRVCWLTGLLGMATLMLLSPWLSQLTFGSAQYQWKIAALGIVPALVAIAVCGLAQSWRYARRVPVPTVWMSCPQSLRAASTMIRTPSVLARRESAAAIQPPMPSISTSDYRVDIDGLWPVVVKQITLI